jgi:hypothetical protein
MRQEHAVSFTVGRHHFENVLHTQDSDRYNSEHATEALLASPGFLDHLISMVAVAVDWEVVLHACGALRNVAFSSAGARFF